MTHIVHHARVRSSFVHPLGVGAYDMSHLRTVAFPFKHDHIANLLGVGVLRLFTTRRLGVYNLWILVE